MRATAADHALVKSDAVYSLFHHFPFDEARVSEIASTPAAEVQENFAFFRGEALKRPVLISTDGRPETVLPSYEEFRRLESRDRQAYGIDDLPPDLAAAILSASVPRDFPD